MENMTELLPFLRSLITAPGLSGNEAPIRSLIETAWQPLTDDLSVSRLGSLHGLKRGSGPEPRPGLLLAAHMDAIGLMVTGIVEGFLRVTEIGGLDARVLPGQRVTIHGRQDLPGLIVQPPGHLIPADAREGPIALQYLLVDTGLLPRQVERLVRVGDLISFAQEPLEMNGETLAGHSLDNRASVAAITQCLEALRHRSHAWDAWAVATVQEEETLGGAGTLPFSSRPQLAVAIDVTWARGLDAPEHKTFPLGKGPTLGWGPNIHPGLFKLSRRRLNARRCLTLWKSCAPLRDRCHQHAGRRRRHPNYGGQHSSALYAYTCRSGSVKGYPACRSFAGRIHCPAADRFHGQALLGWRTMTPMTTSSPVPPNIGAAQIRLLERLCNACAVSGDESEVRAIVLEQVRPLAAEVRVDALGNVLAIRPGEQSDAGRLRVMLAAHMDEVGFMITADEGEGLFRFDTVGGVDERQLVGKPVWVGRDHLPGVIGAKPIHLTTPEERKRAIALDALRIDIGLGGNAKVKPGDRATFATPFARLGPSLRAKALDDRIGVATLIGFSSTPARCGPAGAFTVQEEVGLRGARVAATSQPRPGDRPRFPPRRWICLPLKNTTEHRPRTRSTTHIWAWGRDLCGRWGHTG
jgi:endoglucanase